MKKYHYNLKKEVTKLLKDSEAIPQLSNLISEEFKSFGEVQYVPYNGGGYKLNITSDSEITDFEPLKQIVLKHNFLDSLKQKKLRELNSLVEQKFIDAGYPIYKQINLISDAKKYKGTGKVEAFKLFRDNLLDELSLKEAEINAKIKESTLQSVDLSLSGIED